MLRPTSLIILVISTSDIGPEYAKLESSVAVINSSS